MIQILHVFDRDSQWRMPSKPMHPHFDVNFYCIYLFICIILLCFEANKKYLLKGEFIIREKSRVNLLNMYNHH